MTAQRNIIVQVRVNADIETVWDSFVNSEHVVEWNFASPEWHCPAAMNDLEVGGGFSYRMAAKDGSFQFDLEGTYTSIEPNSRLEYVLSDGRKVSISFEENGGSILVIETFEPENENPIELQQSGWQAILNNYKAYTESL